MECTELGGVCLTGRKGSGKGWLFHHPTVQTIKPASRGWPERGLIGATTSRTGGGILAKSPFSEGLGIETTNCSRLPHREAMISEVTKKIYLGGVGVWLGKGLKLSLSKPRGVGRVPGLPLYKRLMLWSLCESQR